MKQVIIVHCWGGNPNHCWYPQTKRELKTHGFEVLVPAMPETENPKLNRWLPKLREIAGAPNEDLYLVGHSLGCATIMRYLESLKLGERIAGAVFVAGFTDNIDLATIKTKANQFVAINSDDDPYVPLKYGYILEKELGAKLIIKHKMGHFSGPADQPGSCISLPDVTESILEMTKKG